jgi:cytochrome c oxidase assembly factor CtaG
VTWTTWEPAPAIFAGAGLVLLLFLRAFVRLRRRGRTDHAGWSRLALFVAAVALGTLALVSPLHELGDSYLLSAHMLQHVLIGDAVPALALVALRGPLFFFMLPRFVLRRLHPLRRVFAFSSRPIVAVSIWMVVIAAWHVPAAYDGALPHQTVHDLEHVSFILAGVLVWMQIVDPANRRRLTLAQRFGVMLALSAAGAALAGVLVFSPVQLYPAYAGAFGIAPLLDQQLAGIVMLAEQVASLGLCACFLAWATRAERGGRGYEVPVTVADALPFAPRSVNE